MLGALFYGNDPWFMALSRYASSGRRSCVATSEEDQRFARACMELARTVEDKRARASLLHMSQVWLRLAEERASDVDERRSAES